MSFFTPPPWLRSGHRRRSFIWIGGGWLLPFLLMGALLYGVLWLYAYLIVLVCRLIALPLHAHRRVAS